MPSDATNPTPHESAVSRPLPKPAAVGVSIRRGLPGVAVLVLGGLAWWWLATHNFTGGDHEEPTGDGRAAASAGSTVVRLPAATGADVIGLAAIERRSLRAHLTIPGRLDYDARTRLDYNSPVDGIVSRICVQVRHKVAKDESLAEISSPEVGMARDDVRKREDDREIARKAAQWATTIADNLVSLLDALASHQIGRAHV